MIQEIINFTNDLIDDIPDIMEWKVKPSSGLHIFLSMDENGNWIKDSLQKEVNYDYYDGKSTPNDLLMRAGKIERFGNRIGTNMNKVLDKKKQIFSCSPFILSFKKKSFNNNKLEGLGCEKIINLLPSYFENARQGCLTEEREIQLSKSFEQGCIDVLQNINIFMMLQAKKDGTTVFLSIFNEMNDDSFVNIYLDDLSLEKYKIAHENYLRQNLFNKNDYNNDQTISENTYGLSDFLNGLNSKKPFLSHKSATMFKGISGRITAQDAIALYNFEILISNKVLPNPLPIVIDKKELNKEIIRLFNQEQEPMPYRRLLKRLHQEYNRKYLQNYYLLNITKKKGIQIDDFDFVPLFRYDLNNDYEIVNVTQAGFIKDKNFETLPAIKLETIFDFERIVIKEIFNNSLVKIKNDGFSTNYFGEIDPKYVIGGLPTYQQIMKYRRAVYDYIYKSRLNAIDAYMFDDMMLHSVLSNIKTEEVKGRFHQNNNIKKKINIWFSLYNLFDNNKNNIMASNVSKLLSKMRSAAKGESHFETPEEFAFGSGQIVSFLIDRSAASNKTYAMLEPFLQKNKSEQLQDAIAQTIATYKHDISVYKGKFERLASQVLTDDCNAQMKSLLKYFLAGCFCPCVIYESEKNKDENNN